MKTVLIVKNTLSTEAMFFLEPLGEKYRVPAKQQLSVVIDGAEAVIEWEIGRDAHVLTICKPSEGYPTVYRDGVVVRPE